MSDITFKELKQRLRRPYTYELPYYEAGRKGPYGTYVHATEFNYYEIAPAKDMPIPVFKDDILAYLAQFPESFKEYVITSWDGATGENNDSQRFMLDVLDWAHFFAFGIFAE